MNRTEDGEVRVIPIEMNRDVEEIVIDDIADLTGRGILITSGREFAIEDGSLIYLPAGVMHQQGVAEGSSFTQLSIIGGERKEEQEEG
jgi:hypothetical protein